MANDHPENAIDRKAAELSAAFGRLIQEERKAQHLRQDDLALICGTGKRFIVDLEAGKSSCQLGRSLMVADALGLKLTDALRALQESRRSQSPDIPASEEEFVASEDYPDGPSPGIL